VSGALPDFGNLTDPSAIAAARRALDAAAQRAEADAKTAKQHAAAEAERQRAEAFQAEIDSLVVVQPIVDAKAALAEAQARHREAMNAAEATQQTLDRARDLMPALVQQAVVGEPVTAQDVAEAHAGILRAEQHAAFRAVVAGRLAAAITPAEAAVKAAIAEAHRAMADRGIDLRIESGIMVDASM
jgi:hypothetical protein